MIYQLSACSTQHQCRWYCHLCDWFFSPWNQQHPIVNPERLWHLDDNLQVQAQYFKDQVYVCTFFPLFSSTPEGCTWSNPHWAGLQFEISGLHYQWYLTRDDHIIHVLPNVTQNINLLWRLSWFLFHTLITFYNGYVLPSFDYCDVVWQNCSPKPSAKLERLQNYAMRVILKVPRVTLASWARERLGWKTLGKLGMKG